MSVQQQLEACVRYLLDAGEFQAAIDSAKQAGALLPSAELLALLGIGYARIGASKEAIDALRHATLCDPHQARLWVYLAEAHLDVFDQESAASALQRACELDLDMQDPFGKRARLLIARVRKELKASA